MNYKKTAGIEQILLKLTRAYIGSDDFPFQHENVVEAVKAAETKSFADAVVFALDDKARDLTSRYVRQYLEPTIKISDGLSENDKRLIAKGYGLAAISQLAASEICSYSGEGHKATGYSQSSVDNAALALRFARNFFVFPMIAENVDLIIGNAKETGANNLEKLMSEVTSILRNDPKVIAYKPLKHFPPYAKI
jgi:hypothetical protein